MIDALVYLASLAAAFWLGWLVHALGARLCYELKDDTMYPGQATSEDRE